MTKSDNESSNEQVGSTRPTGGEPMLELMKAQGLPLTQEQWLRFNYPEGVPDPLPAELWAEIPPKIREPF